MSAVLILTPVIIASWPVIATAVAGAAATMGLLAKEGIDGIIEQDRQELEQSVEIDLSQSQILNQNISTDKEIVLTKGSIELRIKRDERGRCSVCASGKGHSKAELKSFAEEFTQKMTQCYVYNKVVKELKSKEFKIVNEEVMDDEAIRINVRRWEE